jgi:DNA-binding MarR family transcriptional regulator
MTRAEERASLLEEFVRSFPPRAGRFSRVLLRVSGFSFPRGMAQLLATLEDGPRSVTEIARQEGLAQPTVTHMIGRLESLEFVTRRRRADDRRVVLVELTPAGRKKLKALRVHLSRELRRVLEPLSDEEIFELAQASDTVQRLIERLQPAEPRKTDAPARPSSRRR